jgi:hypothetical protein
MCLRLLPAVVLDKLVKLLLKVVFELLQDFELPQDGIRPRAAVIPGCISFSLSLYLSKSVV